MAVVVHPLSQIGKFFRAFGLSVTGRDNLVERRGTLCSLQRIVVHTPLVGLRPDTFGRIGAQEAFVGQHIGHTALAVELVVAGFQREVGLGRQHAVGTVAAHHIVGRTRNVVHSRMFFLHDTAQSLVDGLRREAFVTTAVQADGGMAADALHIIFGIGDEHVGIIRIGTVGRIGQPEVLPDHNAVLVAGVIQFFVANHTHPVAQHGEVHVGMVGHSCLVFASAVVKVRFAEAPVTATADKTASVDVEVQHTAVFVERHLADTHLEVTGIRYFFAHLERKVCII